MTYSKLAAAIHESERFIEKAKRAATQYTLVGGSPVCGSKHTAAAKRASLDLTRALAEMRKP